MSGSSVIPASTGGSAPVVDTRAAILSGTITAGTVYTANNITHISAGGTGTFTVVASEDGKLPDEGVYQSDALTGNHPWQARMDWQTGRIYYLHDTINNNEVTGYQVIANFPFGNTNVQNNRITNASSFAYTAGIFRQNKLGENARVTLVAGTMQRNEITSNANVTQNGTGRIEDCLISNSNITNQNVNFYDNQVVTLSQINTSGSAGIIQYCTFDFGNALALQNIASLTIYYSKLSNARYLLTGAQSINIRYTEVHTYGYIQTSGTATLLCYYNTVGDLGYIRCLNGGNLNVQRSAFISNGYLDHNCGANATVNRVYRCHADSVGGFRFLGTASNNRFYNCRASSGSYQRFENDSTGCYAYNCSTDSSGYTRLAGCTNLRFYYNDARANGFFYIFNTDATNYIYYCSMTARGAMDNRDMAVNARCFALHGSGLGRFNLRNHAGNIYYSSVTAYYYLQGGKATGNTLQAFHGYGRQSYTMPTTPTQTGTGVRNI